MGKVAGTDRRDAVDLSLDLTGYIKTGIADYDIRSTQY